MTVGFLSNFAKIPVPIYVFLKSEFVFQSRLRGSKFQGIMILLSNRLLLRNCSNVVVSFVPVSLSTWHRKKAEGDESSPRLLIIQMLSILFL